MLVEVGGCGLEVGLGGGKGHGGLKAPCKKKGIKFRRNDCALDITTKIFFQHFDEKQHQSNY